VEVDIPAKQVLHNYLKKRDPEKNLQMRSIILLDKRDQVDVFRVSFCAGLAFQGRIAIRLEAWPVAKGGAKTSAFI
jgi:hypothetical protein